MVCHALNSMDGVSCNIPQGAFYVFPGIHDLLGRRAISGQVIENDVQFATYLLEEALVAVVPGAGFGLNGHFRISYAADKALLVEGMKRIARAIDQLK